MKFWITVGTKAVAGAIYEGRLTRTLPSGYEAAANGFSLRIDSLGHIQPPKLRWEVIHAISSSIQVLAHFLHVLVILSDPLPDHMDGLRTVSGCCAPGKPTFRIDATWYSTLDIVRSVFAFLAPWPPGWEWKAWTKASRSDLRPGCLHKVRYLVDKSIDNIISAYKFHVTRRPLSPPIELEQWMRILSLARGYLVFNQRDLSNFLDFRPRVVVEGLRLITSRIGP